jgi:hypothetical protein
MTVTMKNTIFWDVTPCRSYKNRCSWRRYISRKRRFLQDPDSVTLQKAVFFIVTCFLMRNETLTSGEYQTKKNKLRGP